MRNPVKLSLKASWLHSLCPLVKNYGCGTTLKDLKDQSEHGNHGTSCTNSKSIQKIENTDSVVWVVSNFPVNLTCVRQNAINILMARRRDSGPGMWPQLLLKLSTDNSQPSTSVIFPGDFVSFRFILEGLSRSTSSWCLCAIAPEYEEHISAFIYHK